MIHLLDYVVPLVGVALFIGLVIWVVRSGG